MRLTFSIVLFLLSLSMFSQSQEYYISGPESLCAGECATYTLFSVNGQAVDAHWEIITNNPDPGSYIIESNTPVLFACFFEPGLYTITLSNAQDSLQFIPLEVVVTSGFVSIMQEGDICTDFDPNNPRPACSTYCVGALGIYSLDAGGTSEIDWSVTGGEIISNNINEIIVEWTEPGQHSVSVIGFSSNCTFEDAICVQVVDEAEARIEASPPPSNGRVTLCRFEEILLRSTGSNVAESRWSISNGLQTSGSEIRTAFSEAGMYEVLLIADNGCDCGDTTSLEIEVLEDIAPTLDCIGTVCEGTEVTYTASADCNEFIWSVSANGEVLEGGSQADDFVTVRWNTGPEGTITILANDCNGNYCTHPVEFRIPVISPGASISGDEFVCPGDIATYTAPSWQGVFYNWSTSSGASILSGQGTPELTVIWNNSGLVPDASQFVSVEYDGCYLDCGGSANLDVTILTDFRLSNPVSACPGEPVSFSSQTSYAPITPVDCDWEVVGPNGAIVATLSSTSNAEFNAPAFPGQYLVIARPVDPTSICSDQKTQLLKVQEPPTAPTAITGPDTICPGSTYSFSVIQQGGVLGHWAFINGPDTFRSQGPTANYSFDLQQPREVWVRFERNGCFSGWYNHPIHSLPAPVISGEDNVCAGSTLIYSTPHSDIANYTWEIHPAGSGQILSGINDHEVEVIWLKPGPATITLRQCLRDVSVAIQVNNDPSPQLIYEDSICLGETTNVTTQLAYTSYEWQDPFGSIIGSGNSVDLGPGFYKLSVIDDNGCEASANFRIDALPQPTAVISTPDAKGYCVADPDRHLFVNNTEGNLTFQWYYNGNPLPGETSEELVTHPFGDYQALVTNEYGCSEWSNVLTLFEHCEPRQTSGGAICNIPPNNCPPDMDVIFNVIPSTACNELSFRTNSPGIIPGSQVWFFENFDNVQYDEVQDISPTHTFGHAGYHDVILFVLMEILPGPDTCFYHTNQVVTIPVAADFDYLAVCPGEPMSFSNLSSFIPGEDIVSVEWDFGDPGSGGANTSADYEPQHIYSSPGDYTVQLTVTAASGCTASTGKIVTVTDYPENGFILDPDACPGSVITLQPDISATFQSWVISSPSGQEDTFSVSSMPFKLEQIGIYEISLLSENVYGCTSDSSLQVDVQAPNLPRSLSYNLPNPLCSGSSFQVMAPMGGQSWSWNNGSQDDFITITSNGSYWVDVTTPDDCVFRSDTLEVSFDPKPYSSVAGFKIDRENSFRDGPYTDTLDICFGEVVEVEALYSEVYAVLWNNSRPGSTLTFDPGSGTGLGVGSHQFWADVTDPATQCSGRTDSLVVVVHATPQQPILDVPSGRNCEGDTITISVINQQSGVSYYWNTGASGSTITASAAGEYTVTATNDIGCSNTSEPIIIHKAPSRRWVPAGCLDRCRPDTICIPSFDPTVQIQWFRDGQMIPGATGNQFIAVDEGTYQAEMTDQFGCSNISDPLSLTLFDGFGDIGIQVWRDVNMNGIVDAQDTLVDYTEVVLDLQGSEWERRPANQDLVHYFVYQPQGTYVARFDTASLLADDEIVIGLDSIDVQGCDRMFDGELLIRSGCPADTLAYETEIFMDLDGDGIFSAGDSLLPDFPLDVVEGMTVNKELTGADGSFEYTSIDNEVMIIPDTSGLKIKYEITITGDTLQDLCYRDIFQSIGLRPLCNPVSQSLQYELCPNDSILIEGNWVDREGSYDFVYKTDLGCDSTITYVIKQYNDLPASLPSFISLDPANPITLLSGYAQSELSFQWTPAQYVACDTCAITFLTVDSNVVLGLTVTDTAGCMQNYILELRLETTNRVYIPNAFSPDGNGLNDFFRIFPKEPLEVNEMMIFDRWGDKVFEIRNSSPDVAMWNGTFKGKLMNPAVFVYWIEVTFSNGEKGFYKGDVTLVR